MSLMILANKIIFNNNYQAPPVAGFFVCKEDDGYKGSAKG